jgi:tripartite-type tricarboxylate transporter receptor subunit TctC
MDKKTVSRRGFLKLSGFGLAGATIAGVFSPVLSASAGSDWPGRPIHVVVNFTAGGSSDYTARSIASFLKKELDVVVQVTNTEGAHGAVGGTMVAHSKPNGYTMLSGAAVSGTWPVMGQSDVSWEDFYAFLACYSPTAIFANKDSKYQSLNDFISAIKDNPGKIKIGTTGKGDNGEIFGRQLLKAAGLGSDAAKFIPYNGGRDTVRYLRSDTVDFIGVTLSDVSDLAVGGDIIPIASLSDKDIKVGGIHYESAPQKYPKVAPYTAINPYFGYYISRDTPEDIVLRFGKAFTSVVNKEALKQKLEKRGEVMALTLGVDSDKIMARITSARSWAEEDLGIAIKSPADYAIPRIEDFKWPPNERAKKLEKNKPWPKKFA